MKGPRSILHVDLDPFFVSVQRSLEPALRGRPLVITTGGERGVVAAASEEAREAGVTAGQPAERARTLCPAAVFRQGDLETYARVSDEVSHVLLEASRRLERPSTDEAYVDLTRDGAGAPHPVTAAEAIKDALQKRLGLDASLGLASTRLAARVASAWARPRGLVIVLPGYERSFLDRQPISFLPDLPAHLAHRLRAAGILTLGDVAQAPEERLAEVAGAVAAHRLAQVARAQDEPPVPSAAPPARIQEEARVRDRRTDAAGLRQIVEALADRAVRRLRPFHACAQRLRVEVRRGEGVAHREAALGQGPTDADEVRRLAAEMAAPLIEPAASVRAVAVRLDRLQPLGAGPRVQRLLFA